MTGGHYDPGLACGCKTGNPLCKTLAVPGSSASQYGVNTTGDCETYQCNPEVYQENPAVCELGDLSGKYGKLDVDEKAGTVNETVLRVANIPSSLIKGMSIVVHCNDGTRAFCASFGAEPAGGSE